MANLTNVSDLTPEQQQQLYNMRAGGASDLAVSNYLDQQGIPSSSGAYFEAITNKGFISTPQGWVPAPVTGPGESVFGPPSERAGSYIVSPAIPSTTIKPDDLKKAQDLRADGNDLAASNYLQDKGYNPVEIQSVMESARISGLPSYNQYGYKEWATASGEQVNQTLADLKKAGNIIDHYDPATRKIQYHLPLSQDKAIAQAKAAGKLPDNAVIDSYDANTGTINYHVPAVPLTQTQAVAKLKSETPDAIFDSYDPATGVIQYHVPMTQAQAVAQLKAEGKLPANATITGYDKDTGEVSFSVPLTKEQAAAQFIAKLGVPANAVVINSYDPKTGDLTYSLKPYVDPKTGVLVYPYKDSKTGTWTISPVSLSQAAGSPGTITTAPNTSIAPVTPKTTVVTSNISTVGKIATAAIPGLMIADETLSLIPTPPTWVAALIVAAVLGTASYISYKAITNAAARAKAETGQAPTISQIQIFNPATGKLQSITELAPQLKSMGNTKIETEATYTGPGSQVGSANIGVYSSTSVLVPKPNVTKQRVTTMTGLTDAEKQVLNKGETIPVLSDEEKKLVSGDETIPYLTDAEKKLMGGPPPFPIGTQKPLFQEGFTIIPPGAMGALGKGSINWKEPVVVIETGGAPIIIPKSALDKRSLYQRWIQEGRIMVSKTLTEAEVFLPNDIGIDWDKALVDAGDRLATTKNIDWDSVLSNAIENANTNQKNRARIKAEVKKALADFNTQIKIKAYLRAVEAYSEVLRASATGKNISPATVKYLATANLPKEWTSPRVQEIIKPAELTQAKARTQTKISEQTKPATLTKQAEQTKVMTQTKVAELVKNAELTKAAELTKVAEMTKPAEATKTQTAVKTAEATKAAEQTKTAEQEKEAEQTQEQERIKLKLPKKEQDQVNRQRLQQADGAVIRRQGALHGKDVWHVITYPYRPVKDEFTIVGEPPPGAKIVRGPGSGYASPTMLYGRPPDKPVTMEGGAVDPTLIPDRKRGIIIRYIKDITIDNTPRRPRTINRHGRNPFKSHTTDLGAGIVETRRGGIRRRHLKL
jgi:hypothetical protein